MNQNEQKLNLSVVIVAGLLLISSVTLPVEHNACKRALISLEQTGLATGEDREKVWKVLHAAAFPYLAGVSQRLRTFLFFVVMITLAQGFLPPG
jgi:hypothetical protein